MNTVSIHEPVKLLTQVQEFSFFADDQVLTAGQLNRLIQHADYEDRATRAWLAGAGIVCGLKHRIDGTSVAVEPGCALTSDGDLLTVGAPLKLTHGRPFGDAEAKYGPLVAMAPFVELLTGTAAAGDSTASPLTTAALTNTVLVLYLESYAKEPEFCTGDNCDNKGPVQHNNLRFLLVPKAKATQLPPGLPEIATTLPQVALARPKLNSGIKKLEGNDGLQAAFTTAIGATRTGLTAALSQLDSNTGFRDALSAAGFDKAPDWDASLPGKALNPAVEIKGLLFIYGFYREFCQAYEEWRQSLYCLRGACAPAPDAFPKHVVLGETGRVDRCPPDSFRYPFFRASSLGSCRDDLERAHLLWQRLLGLLAKFQQTQTATEIRITPSAGLSQALGERALPFYYGSEFSAPWNVEARLRCAPDQPLSYHHSPDIAFNLDICRLPFYRIEGHFGKALSDAESELKALRARHNLAFQILSIQIEDDPDLVVVPPIRFLDIETLFHQHTLDLKLRLRDAGLFSDVVSQEAGKAPDTSVSKEKATAVSQASGQLKTSVSAATQAMPAAFSEFKSQTNVVAFNAALTKTVEDGIQVNKLAYDFAKYSPVTPTDRLNAPEALSRFGQLFNLYKNRLTQVRMRSIFQKFVAENPGLEHLGGVQAGGTFVLVYSASDDPSKRIVKADFCLPYYSYFDLTTLAEEEPPADITVQPPPYVFDPKPWKDIYQWTFTPLTDIYVESKFTTLANTIAQTQINITKDVNAIVDSKIVSEILPMPKAGAVITNPGLVGNEFYSDSFMAIEANNREMDRIRAEKERGIAPPDADERVAKLELHNADLLAKTSAKVAENMANAERAGVAVSTADREMAKIIKTNAVTLESEQAKSAFKGSISATVDQNANSPMVNSNFGQLVRFF